MQRRCFLLGGIGMIFGGSASAQDTPSTDFGWSPNEAFTRRFVADLPDYREKILALESADDNADVLLHAFVAKMSPEWTRERDGRKTLRSYHQGNIGSCVGHGTAQALNALIAVQMELGIQATEYPSLIAADAAYGLAREAGGMLGYRGDGCFGSAAAKSLIGIGSLLRKKYGDVDLAEYSVDRCRKYGSQGVGSALKTAAGEHTVSATTQVRNAVEAWSLIGNGYPINVCSNVGFSRTRDKNGVCAASGTWNHSMAITGRRTTADGMKLFLIQNSWGDDWCGGPYWQDMPWGSFFATEPTVDRMMRQGDSFAYSGIQNFRRNVLPDLGTYDYL